MYNTPMNDKILHLIQQAGCLMLMPRAHVKNLGTTFDTVACVMALFHDLAEARTGDIDFVGKHYTKAEEEKAIKD